MVGFSPLACAALIVVIASCEEVLFRGPLPGASRGQPPRLRWLSGREFGGLVGLVGLVCTDDGPAREPIARAVRLRLRHRLGYAARCDGLDCRNRSWRTCSGTWACCWFGRCLRESSVGPIGHSHHDRRSAAWSRAPHAPGRLPAPPDSWNRARIQGRSTNFLKRRPAPNSTKRRRRTLSVRPHTWTPSYRS